MHEMAVGKSLAQQVMETALQHGAQKVYRVFVEIGGASCINENALQNAFEVVVQNTIAAQARLQILRRPIMAQCPQCGEVELDGLMSSCNRCHSGDIQLLDNYDLRLKRMEFS
jgi:hydrogenase nickel incorporation protein HypA/HybF